MAAFVHTPLTDPNDLPSLVAAHAPETQHLDFKAVFWEDNALTGVPAAEEAAKDIAAFANSEGGDFIIGVSDGGNKAGGWCTAAPIAGRTGLLAVFLQSCLYPLEVAGTVLIHEHTLSLSGAAQEVMIVNVPPWPHGVVGVRAKRAGKGHRDNDYYFPFRLQDKTINLTLDEAMQRNEAGKRALYLRTLSLWTDKPQCPVVIDSPLSFYASGSTIDMGLSGESCAILLAPSLEACHFKFDSKKLTAVHSALKSAPTEIYVPFGLVREIWREDDGTVHLFAAAEIMYAALPGTATRWRLRAIE